MDDPFAMRLADGFRDLLRVFQKLEKIDRSAGESLGKRRAFDELQGQIPLVVDPQQIVDGSDVWVIQAREKLGLALEASERRAIIGETRDKTLMATSRSRSGSFAR